VFQKPDPSLLYRLVQLTRMLSGFISSSIYPIASPRYRLCRW
jgi:hypothetical protein